MTLEEFNNNVTPVTYLWIFGVGYPTGKDFNHNVDSDDDYCDLPELIGDLDLWDLDGTVLAGCWTWNGNGNPTDQRGNTIQNVKAS